jgi:hypothetical protein
MRFSLIVLILLFCLGCSYPGKRTIQLSDGTIVRCFYTENHCGAELYDCDDGSTYTCQLNVKMLPNK